MVSNRFKKYFAKKAEIKRFKNASTEEVFTHIYQDNKWGDAESRSGKGSNLEKASGLMDAVPAMLRQLEANTMLDIPCGDFHWMKEVELPLKNYLGADIVKPLIEENQRQYGNEQRKFVHLDLMRDSLPEVDVIFCRECLVHLSYDNIAMALENIKKSGATYLFITDFPQVRANEDCVTGKHHSLNFTLEPFAWPKPLLEHFEYHTGKRRGNKCLSVWKIADIPEMTLGS